MLRDNQKKVVALLAVTAAILAGHASFAQTVKKPLAPAVPTNGESAADEDTKPKPKEKVPPAGNGNDKAQKMKSSHGKTASSHGKTEPSYGKTASSYRKTEEENNEQPPLPVGMSLDAVLNRAAKPPPQGFPQVVPDDDLHIFLLGERLEYRSDPGDDAHLLGLEMQSWFGGDYNRLWMKLEGGGTWRGGGGFEGEAETDLLYTRLITEFWYGQIGAQYANEWTSDTYEDLWSGVVAFQGMAPGMFEVDLSIYMSEKVDFTFVLETEYDIRITQRLVLQPRTELGFAAQDIPERGIGAGMTDAVVDLRLRYEIKREFAPFIGGRFMALVGKTADQAEKAGQDPLRLFVLAGLRFAIY